MGSSNAPHIMTLVNSIIGVSILAMPFCYKQCGILLATLILIFSNLMTRLSCHYLLKSAIMTRRRTFELLAFHAFGNSGKTTVELSIILLMIGTCIAFFVVMGDLGPVIIGSLLEVEYFTALRPAVLIGLAVFVVLPLGLLRNVDSLSSICTASFLFYLFLVFKVFVESTNNLFSGSWVNEVHYWKPSGILQCLPIFSMALSCQTQLLEIFDSVTNGTLDKMNSIVKSAVNLCTALYISVGFFGYVAYYKQTFTGNLLLSFSESYFSEFIKLGFVLSVAVTFPMVIFPCRASLHSLLFKKIHVPHYELVTGGGNHIPEAHFKCITLFIITSSLIVGLLAPNIEIVLGLLGSTIGVIICVLCPPCLFIWISSKATTEKILAQMMCALGIFIMIMGTYANLFLSDSVPNVELQTWKPVDPNAIKAVIDPQNKPPAVENIASLKEKSDIKNTLEKLNHVEKPDKIENIENIIVDKLKVDEKPVEEDKRIEPPIPVAPANNKPDEKEKGKDKIESPAAAVPPANNVPANVILLSENKQLDGLDNLSNKERNNDKQQLDAKSAQKVLSHDEEKLLKKQKEVLKKMRDLNKDKMAAENDNPKSSNLKNERDIKMKSAVETGNQNPNIAKMDTDGKDNNNQKAISNEEAANGVPKRILEIPPLPVLINAGANTNNKEKSKMEVQENILNKLPIEEREKRDLYFVENSAEVKEDPVVSGNLKQSVDSDHEKETAVVNQEQKDGSFMKNVAEIALDNPACDKKENLENIDNDLKKKPQNAVSSNTTISEEKADSEFDKIILSPLNSANSKELLKKPVELTDIQKITEDEIQMNKEGSSKLLVSDSQVKETSKIVSNIQESSENDNNMKKAAKNIILAPSKLSDPSIILQEKVVVDNHVKPAVLDFVKPVLRDLKTINGKADTGNRKK